MADDLLDRLLDLGLEEKTLGPETIRAFAEALRERARLVLDERVRGLEERVAVLEKENAWRGETVRNLEAGAAALEKENRWSRETVEALQEDNAWRASAIETLTGDNESLRREGKALQGEIGGLRAEWQAAVTAHERLLAHHHETLRWLIGVLEELGTARWWGFRKRVKTQLGEIVAALRRELP